MAPPPQAATAPADDGADRLEQLKRVPAERSRAEDYPRQGERRDQDHPPVSSLNPRTATAPTLSATPT
jgi:hypothetical protein